MANFELKMPKLGESITEATITKWLKNIGDPIELDDPILEIATDKVDSEIPSPVEGILKEQLFKEGDVVDVDTVIAIIAPEGGGEDEKEAKTKESGQDETNKEADKPEKTQDSGTPPKEGADTKSSGKPEKSTDTVEKKESSGRFFSPLVRSIASEENIPPEELEEIPGSGQNNRLTKSDLLDYLKNRKSKTTGKEAVEKKQEAAAPVQIKRPEMHIAEGDEVVEMDRMRKLIAEHMVMSEAKAVHITLFAEADLTPLVNWRNKQKKVLEQRDGEKLTFTPIFIEAIAKALRDYQMVNISVDGDQIIKRKNINIGMAAALPNGNLIVPVIRNADHKSLLGLAKEVNDLANRARQNKLKPDEIQGGTFTLTNFGSFGITMGTPIINQPQVGILGVGLIQKKPVVVESPQGDSIAIRYMMDLSLGCDHRVVDGALGGMFLKRVAEYLENFDTTQNI